MSDETPKIIEFESFLECLSDSMFTAKMRKSFSDGHFDLTDEELIEAIIDRAQKVSVLQQSQKSFSADNVVNWLFNDKPLPDHASGSVQDTDM